MARFELCGIGKGGLSASMSWRARKFDEHFVALVECFEMAHRYREALQEEDVRCILNAALLYEQRCCSDESAAWQQCLSSMRTFASATITATLGTSPTSSAAASWLQPARVVETAVLSTGA